MGVTASKSAIRSPTACSMLTSSCVKDHIVQERTLLDSDRTTNLQLNRMLQSIKDCIAADATTRVGEVTTTSVLRLTRHQHQRRVAHHSRLRERLRDKVHASWTMAATLLFEARGVRRKSNVEETPRVVHGFTWVEMHAMATRPFEQHVNYTTTRTTHPRRKHHARTELAPLSRCHPGHRDTQLGPGRTPTVHPCPRHTDAYQIISSSYFGGPCFSGADLSFWSAPLGNNRKGKLSYFPGWLQPHVAFTQMEILKQHHFSRVVVRLLPYAQSGTHKSCFGAALGSVVSAIQQPLEAWCQRLTNPWNGCVTDVETRGVSEKCTQSLVSLGICNFCT